MGTKEQIISIFEERQIKELKLKIKESDLK